MVLVVSIMNRAAAARAARGAILVASTSTSTTVAVLPSWLCFLPFFLPFPPAQSLCCVLLTVSLSLYVLVVSIITTTADNAGGGYEVASNSGVTMSD